MILPLVCMNQLVFFQGTLRDKTLYTMCADMLPLLGAWLAVRGGHVVREVGPMDYFCLTYCVLIRGECSCGASVALCSPTACHPSHRETFYPNAHAHALSPWAPPYLPPPCLAHPSVLAQLLHSSF